MSEAVPVLFTQVADAWADPQAGKMVPLPASSAHATGADELSAACVKRIPPAIVSTAMAALAKSAPVGFMLPVYEISRSASA